MEIVSSIQFSDAIEVKLKWFRKLLLCMLKTVASLLAWQCCASPTFLFMPVCSHMLRLSFDQDWGGRPYSIHEGIRPEAAQSAALSDWLCDRSSIIFFSRLCPSYSGIHSTLYAVDTGFFRVGLSGCWFEEVNTHLYLAQILRSVRFLYAFVAWFLHTGTLLPYRCLK
jgi:hypothetical protein